MGKANENEAFVSKGWFANEMNKVDLWSMGIYKDDHGSLSFLIPKNSLDGSTTLKG